MLISTSVEPQTPQIDLVGSTSESVTLKLSKHENDTASLIGYQIFYHSESTNLEFIDVSPEAQQYTIEQLNSCESYSVFAHAYNSKGNSKPSKTLTFRTNGSKPTAPNGSEFFTPGSNSTSLDFVKWKDNGS